MQIRKILREIEHRSRKKLGQNFLQDESVLNAILTHAGIGEDETVLEIGAGLGVLTECLAERARNVIALEIDPVLYQYLEERLGDRENVTILLQDILRFDLQTLPPGRLKVIGNLPYYISTPILTHLLRSIGHFSLILVMLQKEVAQRVTSGPGTRKYGSLSIAVQCYSEARIVESVPKEAFYPVPKVDSALVELRVLDCPRVREEDADGFFQLVHAAFGQRRKTLRNALLGSGRFSVQALTAAFESTGIAPTRRAETLSIEDFSRLAQSLL